MKYFSMFMVTALLSACASDSSFDTDSSASDDSSDTELHSAYASFTGDDVEIYADGDEVVIESTGRPNHTSSYWDSGNASGLYVEPDTSITDVDSMTPGTIENNTNLFTLRVSNDPSKASSSTSTELGPVGIAVTGVPIYNDQDGPALDLDIGVISGFDRNGGHVGPTDYHYHIEPEVITNDDSELAGVIADGFFLYGRKCYSSITDEYPTDLDASNGHTSETQHSNGEEEYHYHIQNDLYLNSYYLLFPGDYQGTPSSIGS